ncbi:MAG: L,D-transpeptidase family protein [Gammaproteobacteria bacterium]
MKKIYIVFGLALLLGSMQLHAERYLLPKEGSSIIGQMSLITTKDSDTFIELARRYGLGFQELVLANPKVDPWLPGEGTQVVIPTRYILPNTKRKGLILNLAEMRVYYFPSKASGKQAGYVYTYPISIGKEGWDTPNTQTTVIAKKKNPTWTPPESIRKEHEEKNDPLPPTVPPGPDNPLGDYAIRLGLAGYLIHGTNNPRGIGMRVTHGCVRLHPDDIEDLFARVSINTSVTIVNEPYKVAWHEGKLYAEMHPSEGDETGTNSRNLTQFVQAIIGATKSKSDYKVNWQLAHEMAKNKTGLPISVGTRVAM